MWAWQGISASFLRQTAALSDVRRYLSSIFSTDHVRGWCCGSISIYASAMTVRYLSLPPWRSSITWVAISAYAVAVLQSPASYLMRAISRFPAARITSWFCLFRPSLFVFCVRTSILLANYAGDATNSPSPFDHRAGFQRSKLRYFFTRTSGLRVSLFRDRNFHSDS